MNKDPRPNFFEWVYSRPLFSLLYFLGLAGGYTFAFCFGSCFDAKKTDDATFVVFSILLAVFFLVDVLLSVLLSRRQPNSRFSKLTKNSSFFYLILSLLAMLLTYLVLVLLSRSYPDSFITRGGWGSLTICFLFFLMVSISYLFGKATRSKS
ncbi:MAG: hypothetical protein BWZ03_00048 [bacterium ADurb.BinA186]|jgi:hypothetical protein|nr:MAG: hypothetical protein BWZ03_00048 [bacterium ADurb.BinA186]